MSTVEPTEEGTTQPKRNQETTRSITDCLQWAIGGGIGQYLCFTDTQGEGQNGKLYCTLCAVWLSSKGAILKDHVLGKSKKQPDGSYASQPRTHARKAALQPAPAPVFAGCQEMHFFVFGSGFSHFCSCWKITSKRGC